MENGLSASDVALMNRDGFGGDAFMWIFALLILAGGGFGGFGGYGNAATQDFVQNGFNFNDLQDQNRDLMGAITGGTAQSVAATNQTFHDTVNALSDKYGELARDISGVAMMQQQAIANQNECCCSLKQQIAENKYDAAMRDAETNANFTAQIQGVKDMISQNKIEALQAQISALELQAATQNVVRYPNAWTFPAVNPFLPPTTTTTTTGA